MEIYEETKKKATLDNQVFLIAQWGSLMTNLNDSQAVTAEALSDAFLNMDEQAEMFSTIPDDQKDEVAKQMVDEFERVLGYWTNKGAFISNSAETTKAPQYRLTHFGRGLVEGFRMAVKSEGSTTFTIVKVLTKAEVEALHLENASEKDEVCEDCGENHESMINEIMKGRKRRRSSNGDSPFKDLMDMMNGKI